MKKIITLISIIFLYSCPDDDLKEEQPELDGYSCCGENPFELTNIDNLDQNKGEILFAPYFTPNADGIKDLWFVTNLHLYSNASLEIFDSSNESVYFLTDSNQFIGWDGNNLEDGVYRFKLIIENEQTYFQQGYFCLISSVDNELSTVECNSNDPDPIIDYN